MDFFTKKKYINTIIWLFICIPVALFILLIVSVLCSLIFYSNPRVVLNNLLSKEIQFAISLSLTTSIISTLCCCVVAIPCAYLLSRKKFFCNAFVDILVELPIAFPPLVAGVGLLILFGPILGNHLAKIGLKFVFTIEGIIISQFFVAVPFSVKLMKNTFQEIDPRYEVVGRTLKAHPFETFWRITLPLARKGIIGMISLTWARILGEFGATMMLVGATRFKTETLPNALYLNMVDGNLDMVIATAIIFLIIGFSVLITYKLTTTGIIRIRLTWEKMK